MLAGRCELCLQFGDRSQAKAGFACRGMPLPLLKPIALARFLGSHQGRRLQAELIANPNRSLGKCLLGDPMRFCDLFERSSLAYVHPKGDSDCVARESGPGLASDDDEHPPSHIRHVSDLVSRDEIFEHRGNSRRAGSRPELLDDKPAKRVSAFRNLAAVVEIPIDLDFELLCQQIGRRIERLDRVTCLAPKPRDFMAAGPVEDRGLNLVACSVSDRDHFFKIFDPSMRKLFGSMTFFQRETENRSSFFLPE